jgi:Flp pilus assembly protein TadD
MSVHLQMPQASIAACDECQALERAREAFDLGHLAIEEGETELAQSLFQEAVSIDPGNANAWFALARLADSDDEALAHYSRAFEAEARQPGCLSRTRRSKRATGFEPATFGLGSRRSTN